MSPLEEQLQKSVSDCDTREDFLQFMEMLREDLGNGEKSWSHEGLESFLNGLRQVARKYEAYFDTAQEGAEAVHSVSWQHLARLLSAARFTVEIKEKKPHSPIVAKLLQQDATGKIPAPQDFSPPAAPPPPAPAPAVPGPAEPAVRLEAASPEPMRVGIDELGPKTVPIYPKMTPVDLKSALPQMLPKIIAWAEGVAAHGVLTGRKLSEREQQFARKVGVIYPGRVYIKLVESLPIPEAPDLLEAAQQAGFFGLGLAGLTFGHTVFITRGHESPRLLSHELRHVYQYEQAGSIAAFLPKYLEQVIDRGYEATVYEMDARAHERTSY